MGRCLDEYGGSGVMAAFNDSLQLLRKPLLCLVLAQLGLIYSVVH